MNEAEITRFLAIEVMGWKQGIEVVGSQRIDVWKKDGKFIGLYPNANQLDQFTPLTDIAHAFMVEDAIAKMGVVGNYVELLCIGIDFECCDCWYGEELEIEKDDLFLIAHASPKQRSFAAVRALATDEQIASWL